MVLNLCPIEHSLWWYVDLFKPFVNLYIANEIFKYEILAMMIMAQTDFI